MFVCQYRQDVGHVGAMLARELGQIFGRVDAVDGSQQVTVHAIEAVVSVHRGAASKKQ